MVSLMTNKEFPKSSEKIVEEKKKKLGQYTQPSPAIEVFIKWKNCFILIKRGISGLDIMKLKI